MNAALLMICVLAIFAIGYVFYSRFLAAHVFQLSADEPVPARELEDGIDYVPTRAQVLWGHHYTSIAGAAPIVGPALAVIWGWVPALLWVVVGTVVGASAGYTRGRGLSDFVDLSWDTSTRDATPSPGSKLVEGPEESGRSSVA